MQEDSMDDEYKPTYVATITGDPRYASIPGNEKAWIVAQSKDQMTAWGAFMAFLGTWPGYREGPTNHVLLKEKRGTPPVWWKIAGM